MHALDWILIVGSLLVVLAIGIYTQQYVKSVSEFLSGGRVARRYLLAVSQAEMGAGAASYIGTYQVISQSGFTVSWWIWIFGPLVLIVSIFGFVRYRYRETRVLTLAQFLEVRYSKALRLFAGILGFFAGIMNFGIIPAIEARAMVYFLGMPSALHIFGQTIPTFVPLMAFFLAINTLITLAGGLITIMVTDCAEGIISQVLYLVLIVGMLSMFSWTQIDYSFRHQPSGQSFLNPIDTSGLKDFNIWYVLMTQLVGFYSIGAWQNRSGYSSAPLTAHEGRMGNLMGGLRGLGMTAVGTLAAVCTYTYLHHPDFAAAAAKVQNQLATIADPQVREQMTFPVAFTQLLPVGLKGALCATILMGAYGGVATHLHSWGSIFVQDMILPYRTRPLSPRQHILFLRLAMLGVAVFAFFFGVFVPPSDYIAMWFQVTQGIFTTGAGAVIIGGLYWNRGTTAGAWSALIVGSILSIAGIAVRQYDGTHFFLNGVQIAFFSTLIACAVYVGVSLLTCKQSFNMDRMLHRGLYADVQALVGDEIVKPARRRLGLGRIIGFDENFTLGDKWIAGGLFGWNALLSFIAVVGTIWNLIAPWPVGVWSAFWHVIAIVIPVGMALVIGVWFIWGATRDTLDLFRRLRLQKVNPLDNGMVVGHQNLDESVLTDATATAPAPTGGSALPR